MKPEYQNFPIAYFITFRCYGTLIHGEMNAVDRFNFNSYGANRLPQNHRLRLKTINELRQQPYKLSEAKRKIVLTTLISVCNYREWTLYAAHVRSNHVHVVVGANTRPENIIRDLKAYSSRHLNQAGYDEKDRKRWARHGSTKYLWDEDAVEAAVEYVMRHQGTPMSMYELDH
ncbi:MAG TPA: transposase [bacterium]|jgi:REP element-mobilizing transposase RayT